MMQPASILYAAVAEVVRGWQARRRRRPVTDAVIISVGNLEVGGSGKTPLAAHLAQELTRRGHRSAYVSRGYRSQAERLSEVSVVVPTGTNPEGWASSGVRILRGVPEGLPAIIGDEGAMVVIRCPGVPLAFSRRKRRAIEVVTALFRPTHVVLDDAFQSWSVRRDVDIVLLDAERPLGNGRVLPAGTLREGPQALRRAHIIGFNGISGDDALREHARWVHRMVGRPLPVFGIRRNLSFYRDGVQLGPGPSGRVAALSSVGRPRRFEESLVANQLDVAHSFRFPDHFRYRKDDIRLIERELASRGIEILVTTEKDWVKLRATGAPQVNLWVARLELEVIGDDPVLICEKPQAVPAASA
jgi:tetraacyldisaccharide 4'-kinase